MPTFQYDGYRIGINSNGRRSSHDYNILLWIASIELTILDAIKYISYFIEYFEH